VNLIATKTRKTTSSFSSSLLLLLVDLGFGVPGSGIGKNQYLIRDKHLASAALPKGVLLMHIK
jgi:hypothetical protein